jgi:hypothetical protein
MAKPMLAPRKQRTRQHVIADQSVHHVEGFVIDAGHTVQRVHSDYGYDLVLFSYDENGYLEPGLVFLQVKAAESLRAVDTVYVFDLDIRDYNLWMLDNMPVILILFDAGRRQGYWLAIQDYFEQDLERRPKQGARTVRIRIPKRQRVNETAVAQMRELKHAALDRGKGNRR